MRQTITTLILLLGVTAAMAQGSVRGRVVDKASDETLQYVNITVTARGSDKPLKGAITDGGGRFSISGLGYGSYTLTVAFMGYKTVTRDFTLSETKKSHNYSPLYISEDATMLQEVTVTGQKQSMKLEIDRKSFDVSQEIINAGGAATDVLENIPSVEVDTEGNISLRGNTSVEVWINGKSSGLTTDNRAEILEQLPAESIDRVEVIDNPSAKFSAEGSAGIINIVLKKDRKAGYYGSLQGSGSTRGGANTSFNINYSSSKLDTYFNIGYRHRSNDGGQTSNQQSFSSNEYQTYDGRQDSRGNNLFGRAGLTWHATARDELTLSGMGMVGGRNNGNTYPYHYGTIGADSDSRMMMRRTASDESSFMIYGEFNYRHTFSDKHFIDLVVDANRWRSEEETVYQDSTVYYDGTSATEYEYQLRPQTVANRKWEVKLDYENAVTDNVKIEAGYQGTFSHENSPQSSWDSDTWDGTELTEDQDFFNRFIYDMDLHALYATATLKMGKFSLMAGLRGEYWKVHTESFTWEQEHDATTRGEAFDKDYFELFPSAFLSYQLTASDQLQLNYTRRLRRPWGGQLNSFKNTSDASIISYGNPELTPEYSHSFSLNYLKTWTLHSLLLSAYYRPTTDVIQSIKYESSADGLMYSTNMNVSRSLSTGLEMTLKNKLTKWLDLTTSANAYYYELDGFTYDIDGQTVEGDADHNFTWNARVQAGVILPYDISLQASGRYRARQVVTQGYRKSSFSMDLGAKKSFLNKLLTLSVNCRDLLNSRRWKTYTGDDTFTRYQERWRNGRNVTFTLTWNFGNMKQKKGRQQSESVTDYGDSYNGTEE